MAINNPNRIITVSMLSDFFTKLKRTVLNLYYTKQEADDTFALKNGNISNEFSVKNLHFRGGYPSSIDTAYTLEGGSGGDFIRVYSNNGYNLIIPLNGGELVAGSNGFDVSKQVCIFQMPKGASLTYGTYNTITKTLTCYNATNDIGSVIFISDIVSSSSNDPQHGNNLIGFYLLNENANGQTLTYLCGPNKYGLYYGNFDGDNPTTNYLCRWDGAQFQAIATGGGGSIDGNYVIAEESDITEILNTNPIDE